MNISVTPPSPSSRPLVRDLPVGTVFKITARLTDDPNDPNTSSRYRQVTAIKCDTIFEMVDRNGTDLSEMAIFIPEINRIGAALRDATADEILGTTMVEL